MRAKSLAKFSAWARAQDQLTERTVHGGIVTICGVLVALTLFASEVKHCMTTRQVQEMQVDLTRNEKLRLEFNITLPGLPCEVVVLDTGDASGTWQSDALMQRARNGEVHKWQLHPNGERKQLAEWHPPSNDFNLFALQLNGANMDAIKQALHAHEGCNMHGWLALARVAGMVHISVRPEAMLLSAADKDLNAALIIRHMQLGLGMHMDSSKLNMSHVIHTLRFGAQYPGQVNPLEGVARIDRKATGVDKYFIKVVPTDYYTLWGRRRHTHQYSVTEYYHPLEEGEEQPPAVFLLYDLSPIMVVIRESRPGLLHLLVRICAVVGGAFAVTGLWDRIVHRLALLARGGREAGSHTKGF